MTCEDHDRRVMVSGAADIFSKNNALYIIICYAPTHIYQFRKKI